MILSEYLSAAEYFFLCSWHPDDGTREPAFLWTGQVRGHVLGLTEDITRFQETKSQSSNYFML